MASAPSQAIGDTYLAQAYSLNGIQPTTIEQIINRVVVGFDGIEGDHPSTDVGVWDNVLRVIPLYPN